LLLVISAFLQPQWKGIKGRAKSERRIVYGSIPRDAAAAFSRSTETFELPKKQREIGYFSDILINFGGIPYFLLSCLDGFGDVLGFDAGRLNA